VIETSVSVVGVTCHVVVVLAVLVVVLVVVVVWRCIVSVVIENKKPVKLEKSEVVDETDIVRRGYVRKTRGRAWTSKGL